MFSRHLFLTLALAAAPSLFATVIPGRFIVELTSEPVASTLARLGARARLQSTAAASHRTRIRAEQSQLRAQLAQRSARVLDSVDTVSNALFIEASESTAAEIASLPGVRRVLPMRTFRMILDRALLQHHVPEAWSQLGDGRAGLGMKIAIIDSGIASAHPAFQDSGLTAPDSFPRADSTASLAFTSGKIIVARSYVSLLSYRDIDYSVRDRVGHGTALATIAAGQRTAGPLATIAGFAPNAYLGVYKIFGTPGYNDYSSSAAIIKAIDDAVSDGMDVINLSLGDDLAPRLADDPEVEAIQRATQAGVIVVAAAGNSGPSLNTMSSPATAPSAITVGATSSDRLFAASVEVNGLPPFPAVLSSGPAPAIPIVATIADAATFDSSGLLCSAIPAASLSGKIALIQRGSCTFETKLNLARNAGALAAVVFAAPDAPEPFTMSVGAATLPAQMISFANAQSIRNALAEQGVLWATTSYTLGPIPSIPNRLTDFTSAGPNVDLSIKPDLMALGQNVYTATQSFDDYGSMYSPNGFATVQGTSFSSPMVAGAAALLKAARPGLSVDHYRSLLINTAGPVQGLSGGAAAVQKSGAGRLNVLAALNSTLTASPVSLSFGAGPADSNLSRTLTLTNLAADTETLSLSVEPAGENPAPSLESSSIELAPGASTSFPLTFHLHGATTGPHQGFLVASSTSTGRSIRVPYWFAATTGTPASISLISPITSARRGSVQRDAILFRILDISGLALTNDTPEVSVVSGGGATGSVKNYDSIVPGLFGLDVQLGFIAGPNVFRIRAGDIVTDVTITGQ